MSTQSLTPGWKMLKFGDIAQNIAVRVDPRDAKTDVYVGLEHLDPSTIHLHQWGQPSDVTGQKLAFKKGDVIFGRRRAYQRKLAVAEFDGICSAHAMVVRAKPKMILPEFLPFFLQSDMFMERAIEISVGSLSPTINWKTLRVQEFPLPPLDERKRIAEVLWAADEAIENYRVTYESAKEAVSIIFERLSHDQKSAKWNDLPLEEVVSRFVDYRGKTPRKTGSGVQLITAKNVRDGFISEEPAEYIADDDYSTWMRRGIPTELDILFTTEAPMGNVAFAPKKKFALAQRIICLSPNEEKVIPSYLFWGLRSRLVMSRIVQKATGTTVLGIKQANLRKVLFPVPPIDRQKEISKLCDQIARSSEEISNHIDELYAVRRSLLNSTGFWYV